MSSFLRNNKKSDKYIPDIAKRLNWDVNNTEEDNGDVNDVNTPLSADFIQLQGINPPAVKQTNNRSDIRPAIGIPTKIGMLINNPYHNRPSGHRKHNKQGNKQLNRNAAINKAVIKEIHKEALKEQEQRLNDSLIKPLTQKGIKLNNIRTFYPK